LNLIFTFLDTPRQLITVCSVCKRFYSVNESLQSLWETFYFQRWSSQPKGSNTKEEFAKAMNQYQYLYFEKFQKNFVWSNRWAFTDLSGIVVFEADATEDISVCLADNTDTLFDSFTYEVTVSSNQVKLRVGQEVKVVTAQQNPMARCPKGKGSTKYWMSVTHQQDGNLVAFGRGTYKTNEIVHAKATGLAQHVQIKYVGFSSNRSDILFNRINILGVDNTKFGIEDAESVIVLPPLYGNYVFSMNWKLLKTGSGGVIFEAKASNDLHLCFAVAPGIRNPLYEIVIGGWSNSQTAVRVYAQGDLKVFTSNPKAQCTPGWAFYWARVNSGLIQFGKGNRIDEDLLLQFQDPNRQQVAYFGLSTWNKGISVRNVRIKR